MFKQLKGESPTFSITKEDFPELPGPGTSSRASNTATMDKIPKIPKTNKSVASSSSNENATNSPSPNQELTISPEGNVTNLPGSMLSDQFGMIGLLSCLRTAEIQPDLVSLALGCDLTSVGLSLTSSDNLTSTFKGPWGEHPLGPEDAEFPVPPEYYINDVQIYGHQAVNAIREKLTPLKMSRFKDELLFYIFYTFTGNVLQLLAASVLYDREWRYHTEEQIWISRSPGLQGPLEMGNGFERGVFLIFDPVTFKKVPRELYLEYSKLEGRPVVPLPFSCIFE